MTAARGELQITAAHWSEAGAKPGNEDACGAVVPPEPLRTTKGVAAVIADGVSGSEAGKEASEACVQGFLSDYLSTPESWSVKTSGEKVLTALNRWLHGQGHQLYGTPRGMVTTLSVLVIKSSCAHLFHIGDTRIYRLRDHNLERLTRDHRTWVGGDKHYLSRAMGIELHVDIDYRTLPVEQGDIFLLTTDGVHDFITTEELLQSIRRYPEDLQRACTDIVSIALKNGSDDNLSCQIVRVDRLPGEDQDAFYQKLTELPFPPPLEPGMKLDGYRILRQLHASKRTELYLALDEETGEQVVLKAPSVNYSDDPAFIELFLHEEWVGKRIHSPHVLKVVEQKRPRRFLYYLTEHVEGQTLRQWMRDHPRPALSEVRDIVEQIAQGLRAFHRMEMIHQDLKPENIMIDRYGTAKIIDFGSTKIAGIEEIATPIERTGLLGTVNYTAPEYLRGERGSNRSDIFSLGVIAYEMLTGGLPYGEGMNQRKLNRLDYTPATRFNPEIAPWVDGALKKAVDPEPARRYTKLSEFVYDLSHPNPALVSTAPKPLLERNPVAFWKGVAVILLLVNIALIVYIANF